MKETDYFKIKRRKHYMQLDAEAVREHAGAGFQVEQDPHPFVVLDGAPTMAAYKYIREAAEVTDDETEDAALVTLAVTIRALGGDWRLYAGSRGEESPRWPDLCDPGGIDTRRQLVARFFAEALVALSTVANEVLTPSEDEVRD